MLKCWTNYIGVFGVTLYLAFGVDRHQKPGVDRHRRDGVIIKKGVDRHRKKCDFGVDRHRRCSLQIAASTSTTLVSIDTEMCARPSAHWCRSAPPHVRPPMRLSVFGVDRHPSDHEAGSAGVDRHRLSRRPCARHKSKPRNGADRHRYRANSRYRYRSNMNMRICIWT